MMIDLDRFKAVNDTLGHPIGDRLLRRVSERLSQLMRDNQMRGRLGGDEFAIVMREAGDTDRIEKLEVATIETPSRPYERSEEHTSALQSLMRSSDAGLRSHKTTLPQVQQP